MDVKNLDIKKGEKIKVFDADLICEKFGHPKQRIVTEKIITKVKKKEGYYILFTAICDDLGEVRVVLERGIEHLELALAMISGYTGHKIINCNIVLIKDVVFIAIKSFTDKYYPYEKEEKRLLKVAQRFNKKIAKKSK